MQYPHCHTGARGVDGYVCSGLIILHRQNLHINMYIYMCMTVWCGCFCRFVTKYHPRCVKVERDTAAGHLQGRLQAFLFLLESGRLGSVPLDQECADAIVKVMDAGVPRPLFTHFRYLYARKHSYCRCW